MGISFWPGDKKWIDKATPEPLIIFIVATCRRVYIDIQHAKCSTMLMHGQVFVPSWNYYSLYSTHWEWIGFDDMIMKTGLWSAGFNMNTTICRYSLM